MWQTDSDQLRRVGSNHLESFTSLSDSDCSKFELGCDCLETGYLPPGKLCNPPTTSLVTNWLPKIWWGDTPHIFPIKISSQSEATLRVRQSRIFRLVASCCNCFTLAIKKHSVYEKYCIDHILHYIWSHV